MLGFSTELIVYLIESCVSNNHTSIRYIEKSHLAGQISISRPSREAKQGSLVLGKMYYAVMNAFGITGRKAGFHRDRLYQPLDERGNGFDSDIILLRHASAPMASLHQPNFKYTDSILPTGTKAGSPSVRTLQNWMRRTRNAKKFRFRCRQYSIQKQVQQFHAALLRLRRTGADAFDHERTPDLKGKQMPLSNSQYDEIFRKYDEKQLASQHQPRAPQKGRLRPDSGT